MLCQEGQELRLRRRRDRLLGRPLRGGQGLEQDGYCSRPLGHPHKTRAAVLRHQQPPGRPGRVRPHRRAPRRHPAPARLGRRQGSRRARPRGRGDEEDRRAPRPSFGVKVVPGFTGSPSGTWSIPSRPTRQDDLERGWRSSPRSGRRSWMSSRKLGVKFALEVHPTEIAFDIASAERASRRWTAIEPSASTTTPATSATRAWTTSPSSTRFKDRIFHAHMKDVRWASRPALSGVFGGHLPFGDPAASGTSAPSAAAASTSNSSSAP
jgi:hypothetical protein